MEYRKPAVLLSSIALFLVLVSGASVGTAPGTLDLGELQPGNTYEAYFYVTTRGITSNFVVEPQYDLAPRSMFEREPSGFDPAKSSQQDISEWIEFSSDSYIVDPSERNVASLDGGGSVIYNERIRFTIEVPQDAEPGYHVGGIDLDPNMDRSGAGGSSVLNMALTQPIFYFEVPGVAERDLEIVDVRAVRSGSDEARFDFIVKNNGTVTTWVRRSSTQLHDSFGDPRGELSTGGQYVSPGETQVISTNWNSGEVDGGDYRVEGELDYITGQSFVDETVSISDVVQVESEDPEESSNVPSWIIIMVLVVLGAVMYSFEIDPVYIFTLIGVVGISAFILISGLPAYLILLLILLTVVVMVVAN